MLPMKIYADKLTRNAGSPRTESTDMDKTDYHLPTTELMQAGETYARLGLECPWVGDWAWVDLQNSGIIYLVPNVNVYSKKTIHCPPAVAAAVLAFALDVMEFWWTKSHCTFMPCDTEEGSWEYRLRTLRGAHTGEQAVGKLAAAVALILAVHKAVEGE